MHRIALVALVLVLPACQRSAEPAVHAADTAGAASQPSPLVEEVQPLPAYRELPGGVTVRRTEDGAGPHAANGDRIAVHYRARSAGTDEELESTFESGVPHRFTLGRAEVVRGLDRGLVGTQVGARLELRVPAALAYGADGYGRVAPDTDLVFDVQVMEID